MINRMHLSTLVSPTHLSRLQQVIGLASELGWDACLVGGFVRDALLGRPINDFDIVIEGNAIKLGRALVRRLGGRLTVHTSFRTATWYPSGAASDFVDLVSARSEVYDHPAALPTVKMGTLEEDLHRRDFTINAIAMRLGEDDTVEVVDPLNGRQDIQSGLLRVMHPRSFIEDPTRLFRLVRYSIRYGFIVEPGTEELIVPALAFVNDLSPERLRHELDLILEEQNFLQMFEKLSEYALFKQIKPGLPFDDNVLLRLRRISEHIPEQLPAVNGMIRDRCWTAWLLSLSEKEIRAFGKRLHLTANLLKQCLAASVLHNKLNLLAGMVPSQVVASLQKMPIESIQVVLISDTDGNWKPVLEKYLVNWMKVKPHIKGEELILRGVPFGPRIGEILFRLRAGWLDGEIIDEAAEYRYLEKLLDEVKRPK